MAPPAKSWRAQVRDLEGMVKRLTATLETARADITERERLAWQAYQFAWKNYFDDAQALYDAVRREGYSRKGDVFKAAKGAENRAWAALRNAWRAWRVFHDAKIEALDKDDLPPVPSAEDAKALAIKQAGYLPACRFVREDGTKCGKFDPHNHHHLDYQTPSAKTIAAALGGALGGVEPNSIPIVTKDITPKNKDVTPVKSRNCGEDYYSEEPEPEKEA